MQAMGATAFKDLKKEKKLSQNKKMIKQTQCVARRIIAALDSNDSYRDWEVQVFVDETPNAFALPGKKIGVHEGIFKVAKTSDQLAAIMGHEVGHVIARHGNERVSQGIAAQTAMTAGAVALESAELGDTTKAALFAGLGLGVQVGVLLPYSRAHESEADVIGMELIAKAGFNPKGAVEIWENMAAFSKGGQPPAFLSTHPSHNQRIKKLSSHLPQANSIRKDVLATKSFPSCDE